MKIKFIILLAVLLGGTSIAQKKSSKSNIRQFYEVDRGHSYLEFSILYMGYAKVKGRFTEFEGMLRYDENDLSNTSISLNIKTESIDTDLDWRDNDLKSDAWFNAEKFPLISFRSKSIISKDKGFDVVGDLTIRDVTREVTINMNPPSGVLADIRGDSQVIFTGNLTIDRTDYGVAGERWSKIKENIAGVGNYVDIEISILGKRMNAGNLSGWFRNEERAHSKIYKAFNDSGINGAVKEFKNLKETDEKLNANAMRLVGHMLLLTDKPEDALAIFQENIKAFPDDAEAYTDLGEGYAENGDIKNAIVSYEKALEVDPQNMNAAEILRNIK